MINLIGFKLSEAVSLIEKSGYKYTVKEYTSTKPLKGTDSERVVRYSLEGDTVHLLVSGFKTKV